MSEKIKVGPNSQKMPILVHAFTCSYICSQIILYELIATALKEHWENLGFFVWAPMCEEHRPDNTKASPFS